VIRGRPTAASGIPDGELPRCSSASSASCGARGRSYEGSGIGLALVARARAAATEARVVRHQHGGRGSTFRVELPEQPGARRPAAGDLGARGERSGEGFAQRGAAHGATASARSCCSQPAEGGRRCSSSTTTPTCATYLTRLLEPEYVVRTAVDGDGGLAQIAERPPDLVLTDVMMPKLDGFELLPSAARGPATGGCR
jgi:hypothetical protein